MNNRGVALFLALGTVAILATLGVGYSARLFNEHAAARKNLYATQAFWISEGGMQKAVWDYNNNNCQGMTNAVTGVVCSSCSSCGSGDMRYAGTLGNGEFTVTYDPVAKTYVSSGATVQGSGSTKKQLASRTVKVFLGRNSIFGFGVFCEGALTIANNSLIDSYNSNAALYNAATANANGNVGTNGSSVNVVEIENNSVIKGVVSTGPGGTVDYKPSKVAITGGITHTNDIYLDPVTVPAYVQAAVYSGVLNVPGVTTLNTGVYKYDSLSIGNNGTVNVNGHVTLYLTNTVTALTTGNNTVAFSVASGGSLTIYTEGRVDFGNKALINNNTTNRAPANIAIYSRFTGANGIIIDNNNEFYGTVYAPQTDVILSNNGAYYGSVIGKTVSVANNGQLHYDEALKDVQAPWQPLTPRDWQEVFP